MVLSVSTRKNPGDRRHREFFIFKIFFFDPGTARLVAQCLNHCATPGPNIKTYFKETQCYGMNWTVVNVVLNLRILHNAQNCLISWKIISFLRRNPHRGSG